MNTEKMKTLENVSRVAWKEYNCFTKKCKDIYDIAVKERSALFDEVQQKYTSKQITTKEYTDRLKQLNEEMKHTEHSLKLIECSAKACRIQMKRTLEAVADALEYACKKEKNKASCAKQVKVRTIAASKIITPKQYLEAMSYTPKPTDK